MTEEMMYPNGALSPEQHSAAAYGAELLRRLARSTGSGVDVALAATPLPGGSVVVVERMKGGGQLYVAPDRTVLYVGSAVSEKKADALFARGRRTPLSSFGDPV